MDFRHLDEPWADWDVDALYLGLMDDEDEDDERTDDDTAAD
jgi:hypothetical protein